QNPVDLDYKAMSNAGTWLVGRLQTENDKARVLEGLRSAAGGTDVAALDKSIGALGKRQFLLVSAKSSAPRLFTTRWAMSYLCGPLTKEQVARLEPAEAPKLQSGTSSAEPAPTAAPTPAAERVELAADESSVAPPVASSIPRRPGPPASAPCLARAACARFSQRASRSATTTARRASTSSRSSRRSTARSTAPSTSTARRRSTTTSAISQPRRRQTPSTCCRARPSRRMRSS